MDTQPRRTSMIRSKARHRLARLLLGILSGTLIGVLSCQPPPTPTGPEATGDLLRAGHLGAPENWPMYGGTYSQVRYSPLDQINPENIEKLKPAWIFHTQVESDAGHQTTPVIVGRAMYVTTPMAQGNQQVIKLDAEKGREIWRTSIPLEAPTLCCGANNKGVAVSGDKVFLATVDARLVALNAPSGRVEWTAKLGEPEEGYSNTMAPLTFGDKVFVGSSGGDFGIRGFLKAFDTQEGELLWTWHSIPSPEQGGWEGDWLEAAPGTGVTLNRDIPAEKAARSRTSQAWRRGGGGVWMTPTLDPDLGLLYVHVGNPSPVFDGQSRPGDNRWTASICAIRIEDGELEWGFQYLPHDVWDYGGGSPPLLFDAEFEGRRIKAAGVFTKLGFFYLLDRTNGQLLRVSEPYIPQRNLFQVPTEAGVIAVPGVAGGTAWSPGAYHPGTGLVYTVAVHLPVRLSFRPNTIWQSRKPFHGGVPEHAPGGREEGHGRVVALDPFTGKVEWSYRTRQPIQSGLLTTASKLVFAGQAEGSFDAWHASTGRHLWSHKTPAGINAAPATYRINGRQHIVVAAGGSFGIRLLGFEAPLGDAIVAFALPSVGD